MGRGHQRRRLSPQDRRAELLALGAEIFGARPYDEVHIDEIAERAGVSRALMYHYFPDKRTFFAEVVRAENQVLYELTNTLAGPDQTLFDWVRTGVLAYLRYDERHPHGAWSAYVGLGTWDPVLRNIESQEIDRQVDRMMTALDNATDSAPTAQVRRMTRAALYSWHVFTAEFCRQRVLHPALDADLVADTCAHTLFDALDRLPGLPANLARVTAERPWAEVVGPQEHDG